MGSALPTVASHDHGSRLGIRAPAAPDAAKPDLDESTVNTHGLTQNTAKVVFRVLSAG
jgi:hypothetical protein